MTRPPFASLRTLVIVAGAAFALGFAAASAQTRHVAPHVPVAKSDSRFDTGPTPYFPSQYELKAGPPGEHVQAF